MVQNRKINPWEWQNAFGFSQAIETTGHTRVLRCSGQTPVDENGAPVHVGDLAAQFGKAVDNLETVLAAAEMTLANVVRLHVYVTDMEGTVAGAFRGMADRLRAAGVQPAVTLIGVTSLFSPEVMVEIEAEAVA